MATREKKASAKRPILLVGSGRRPREIGAVLGALASVRAESGEAVEPLRPHGLGDVEELLSRAPGDGTLVLDCGRVPGEDIGFVRRFLERHPTWRLLVVGDDPQDQVARALLGLPRTQWLPWPPDLDVLGALLAPSSPSAAGRRAPKREAPATRPTRSRPPTTGTVDVGSLLEEILAGTALTDDGAPRFVFECEEPVPVAWDSGLLTEILQGLFALARGCAGPEGEVGVRVDPPPAGEDGAFVQVRVDFPPGPLTDADLPLILEGDFQGDAALAEDVAVTRTAVALLQRNGGAARLVPNPPEGLRLEARLPERPAPAGERPAGPAADRGSPEDPFA